MTDEKLTYDFSTIELKDLDQNVITNANFHKTIANILYLKSKNLDLVSKAILINEGKPVELIPSLLSEVENLILDDKNGVSAFARKAFKEYIDGKRNSS